MFMFVSRLDLDFLLTPPRVGVCPTSGPRVYILLYNLIFVLRLYCLDFQMGRNLWNAYLTLASLCMSYNACFN
jgi:hypothetical protein